MGIFQVGVKIKNAWNHHPEILKLVGKPRRFLVFSASQIRMGILGQSKDFAKKKSPREKNTKFGETT